MLTVSGVTDSDALIEIVADGTAIFSGRKIPELGGTINEDGVFSIACRLDPGVSTHKVVISAKDAMDNLTISICTVYNKGLANVTGVDIYMNGLNYQNKNLRLGSGQTTAEMKKIRKPLRILKTTGLRVIYNLRLQGNLSRGL